MGQGSRWGAVVYPPSPRQNQTDSEQQIITNGRVKVGHGSKWAKDSLVESAVKTIESNESTWAWVKLGLAYFGSESNWVKELIKMGRNTEISKKTRNMVKDLGGEERGIDGRKGGVPLWLFKWYPEIQFSRKNPTQKFILQDFTLAISARKTGENYQFYIS